MWRGLCGAGLGLWSAFSSWGLDIYGHRGARAIWPENSRYGFQYALSHGIDHLELDIHMTADGEFVVLHDARIPQRCRYIGQAAREPVEGRVVAQMKASQVLQYDCGQRRDRHGFPEHLRPRTLIPTLKDVVFHSLQMNPFVHFSIEVKYSSRQSQDYPKRPLLVEGVVRELHDLGIERQTTLQSFDRQILRLLHRQRQRAQSGYRLAFLYLGRRVGARHWADWWRVKSFLSQIEADVFSPHYKLLTTPVLAWAFRRILLGRGRKFEVIPFTVNRIEDWNYFLKAFPVDGLITDDPVGLKTYLEDMALGSLSLGVKLGLEENF